MKLLSALASATVVLALGLSAFNVQEANPKEASVKMADEAALIAEQMPTYPLTTCIISGESFDGEDMGEPVNMLHEGRLVRLCCKSCVKSFKKDPAKHMATIDAAIISEQLPNYPLDTCPISGNEFGEEHPGINMFHGTRLVRFCCEDCVKSYKKNPAKAMAVLDAAYIAAQLPDYKLTTCPVSGEALGGGDMGEPINMLYGNTLVRLCCKGCVKGFKKEPAKYMAMMEA